MPWWTWIAAGALLLVFEAVLPTDFFLVFFGAAGLVVGLALLAGLHAPAWAQWLLFAALSIASLVVLRPRLRRALGKDRMQGHTELVGEVVIAGQEIAADGTGQGQLRGTVWKIHNAGGETLRAGERCRVARVEGLTLHVTREG
jgi:membrane protein implicated in regulation of membrane protease activity